MPEGRFATARGDPARAPSRNGPAGRHAARHLNQPGRHPHRAGAAPRRPIALGRDGGGGTTAPGSPAPGSRQPGQTGDRPHSTAAAPRPGGPQRSAGTAGGGAKTKRPGLPLPVPRPTASRNGRTPRRRRPVHPAARRAARVAPALRPGGPQRSAEAATWPPSTRATEPGGPGLPVPRSPASESPQPGQTGDRPHSTAAAPRPGGPQRSAGTAAVRQDQEARPAAARNSRTPRQHGARRPGRGSSVGRGCRSPFGVFPGGCGPGVGCRPLRRHQSFHRIDSPG